MINFFTYQAQSVWTKILHRLRSIYHLLFFPNIARMQKAPSFWFHYNFHCRRNEALHFRQQCDPNWRFWWCCASQVHRKDRIMARQETHSFLNLNHSGSLFTSTFCVMSLQRNILLLPQTFWVELFLYQSRSWFKGWVQILFGYHVVAFMVGRSKIAWCRTDELRIKGAEIIDITLIVLVIGRNNVEQAFTNLDILSGLNH